MEFKKNVRRELTKEELIKMGEVHKCSICGKEFVGFGNNPSPIPYPKSGYQCCDDCNSLYVKTFRYVYMITSQFSSNLKFEKNSTNKSDLCLEKLIKIRINKEDSILNKYIDLDREVRTEINRLSISNFNDLFNKDYDNHIRHFLGDKTTYNEFIYELMIEIIFLKKLEECKCGEEFSFEKYTFKKK